MNYMKEVAQMLGVELYEEFRIDEFSDLYRLTETGIEFHSCLEWVENIGYSLDDILTGKCKIIKLQKSILNDEEKEYLSHVIKPFRETFESITKYEVPDFPYEYIVMTIKHGGDLNFPYFKKGTMYKGMELDKEYSVDDLGI